MYRVLYRTSLLFDGTRIQLTEIESLITWITDLISQHLYFGVFLAALIETVFPPIPTLAIFPLAGFVASKNNLPVFNVILLGLAGGIGATIGSTVIYLVAYKLGRVVLLKYLKYARISESKLARVETWFAKHGDKAVFFGRLVPVLREMISIPAGLLKMKIAKFVLYTFLGSCIWSTGIILAGYYFGVAVFEFS